MKRPGRAGTASVRGTPGRRAALPKRYDREYFERWYRRSRYGLGQREFVRRKVALALAAAEYVLGRRARSALDVGCGEAPWRAHLLRLRPGLRYVGVESSDYALRRFGRARGIRRGELGALDRLGLRRPFDLVVCADVLHYVSPAQVRRGLRALARLTRGVAFVEAFTRDDEILGDHVGFQRRSRAAYRRLFRAAGLEPLGLHLYVPRRRRRELLELEGPSG